MTIIRKGVERIGAYSVTKQVTKGVTGDGVEDALLIYAIPPYTHLGYIHKLKIMAIGSGEQLTFEQQDVQITGRIVNVDESYTSPLTGNSWDDYMEDNAGIDPATILAGTDAASVGMSGGQVMAHEAEAYNFLNRSYTCRLGQNSYNTNASLIRYLVECNYKGHARTAALAEIAKPKLLIVGMNTIVPIYTTNAHDAAGGSYSTWRGLYEALVENIPSQNVDTASEAEGDALPETGSTMLKSYLHKGVALTDFNGNGADGFNVQLELSARLDVYRPSPGNYVPAP